MIVKFCLHAALIFSALGPVATAAEPARIIILRHGEKQDPYRLCDVGIQRSQALVTNYLGRGAANSLFRLGTQPDGFFAITLHTLELAAPSARSWGLPVLLYPVLPGDEDKVNSFDQQTQAAAQALADPQWAGKTVVMVWERKHIAEQKLDRVPTHPVTLRRLLGLDRLVEVPLDWPGTNYDYFWIVDNTDGAPSTFRMQKQTFPAPYEGIPKNDWGDAQSLDRGSNCKQ